MSYFSKKLYPRNFILCGKNMDSLMTVANAIVTEAAESFPEEFSTKEPMLEFELRYVPPFEKPFNELKRLQGTAALKARYQNEYRGYLVIDVSNYVKHENEYYFDISLKFLSDYNDCWKYIFLIGSDNAKASSEMIGKILSEIYCHIIDESEMKEKAPVDFINEVALETGAVLSKQVISFLTELIVSKKIEENTVKTIVCELSRLTNGEEAISISSLEEHLKNKSMAIKYMLSPLKYKEITEFCSEYVDKNKEAKKYEKI